MEPISEATQLQTIAGVAATVYVFMQIFVKPWLRRRYGISETGSGTPEQLRVYSAAMNTVTGILGVLFAVIGSWATTPAGGHTPETYLTAFLVGLGGAFTAIGVHEAATNLNKRYLK